MDRREPRGTDEIDIVLLGVGQVGRALLRMLASGRLTSTGKKLRVVAVADSRGALIDQRGLTEQIASEVLNAKRARRSIAQLAGAKAAHELEHVFRPGSILVDATAGDTADMLHLARDRGCGIVLANKRPLAGPWPQARRMFADPLVRYEATVGAGLPVISTMRSLIDCGDCIESITGVLSGSIGYLCSQWEQGVLYSKALGQARALGYTEPDPRDDLSGLDVARKALILARTSGWPMEISDIDVEPIYPEELAHLSVDVFLDKAGTLDTRFNNRVKEAQVRGQALRYVAHVDMEGGKAALRETKRESPIGILEGPGNAVIVETRLYKETPLVISGPGAGPAVTAAGVLADILQLGLLLTNGREER